MKIAIDTGHTLTGADTGAQGSGYKEENLTRDIGGRVISKLKALGYEVLNVSCDNASSLSESLSYRTNKANSWVADLLVSIHLNASVGGYGTEVWVYTKPSNTSVNYAKNVVNAIASLGYANRGVKYGNLHIVRESSMPAILVECCFIDSSQDMAKFNADVMASAIVKGITGRDVGITNSNVDNKKYVIGVDSMGVRTFSSTYYAAKNPDVVAVYGNNVYKHYVDYGKAEGRKPLPPIPKGFSEAGYLYNNPDVAKAVDDRKVVSALDHYYEWGWKENRKFIMPNYEEQIKLLQEKLNNCNKSTNASGEVFYRVVIGSYKEKANADAQMEKLNKMGLTSFIEIYVSK